MNSKRNKDTGAFEKTHGMKKTRLYRVWCSMKERCYNPNNKSYKNYGNKGIEVCDDWRFNFLSFFNWAYENGYKSDARYGECTLDRIDFNSDYSPENCRFIPISQQNRNYSKNVMVTYNGETLCLADMARKYGVKSGTARLRINKGLSLDKVFTKGDFRYAR